MNTYDDDRTAELLAQALNEEAAFTQPHPDALQRIQERIAAGYSSDRARGTGGWTSRTNAGRPSWGWLGGAFGAGLATAAVITTVVLIGNQGADNSAPPATQPTQSEPSQTEPTQQEPTASEPTASEPTGTEPTEAEPTGEVPTVAEPTATEPTGVEPAGTHEGVYDPNAPADRQVTMYYVGPEGRLYAEPHTLPVVPEDALAAVQEWWTSLPIDPDLMPVMMGRPDLQVVDVSQSGQTTTIALEGPEGPTSEDQGFLEGDHLIGSPKHQQDQILLYYQALLRTAGVEGEARFAYNGEIIDESNGVRLDPLRAMPDEEVRAWIDIVTPVEGQRVSNPVTVTVSANVFEGHVNWELYDEAGTKLDDGFVTTAMGVWRQADIELGMLEEGTYSIRCFESSAEDGRPINIVDKTFRVE